MWSQIYACEIFSQAKFPHLPFTHTGNVKRFGCGEKNDSLFNVIIWCLSQSFWTHTQIQRQTLESILFLYIISSHHPFTGQRSSQASPLFYQKAQRSDAGAQIRIRAQITVSFASFASRNPQSSKQACGHSQWYDNSMERETHFKQGISSLRSSWGPWHEAKVPHKAPGEESMSREMGARKRRKH